MTINAAIFALYESVKIVHNAHQHRHDAGLSLKQETACERLGWRISCIEKVGPVGQLIGPDFCGRP